MDVGQCTYLLLLMEGPVSNVSTFVCAGDLTVNANPPEWEKYGPLPPEPKEGEEPKEGQVKGHWNMRLTTFQKLIFIKAFQDEKVSDLYECAKRRTCCALVMYCLY